MSTIITDNPYTFTVSDNMNINAVFENNTANITVYKYPSLSTGLEVNISVSGGGTKIVGSTCTLTATTTSSFYNKFVWLDLETGDTLGTGSTYTFTVSKDQTIYCATARTDGGAGKAVFQSTSGSPIQFTLTKHDGTSFTVNAPSSGSTIQTSADQWEIKYISFPSDTSGGPRYLEFGFPFNLIWDSSHPLGKNNWGDNMRGNYFINNSGTTFIAFGPRNGETIYLKSSTPWTYQSNTPKQIFFQQKYAPDFNVQMDIPTGVSVHYPSYGVGYNSDWVSRNFKSNTPTLVKDNNY